MGVAGLLSCVKRGRYVHCIEITNPGFDGEFVGADAYMWLYKCARLDKQKQPRYTAYFHFMVDTLQKLGIKPYLIFDGNTPPVKTERYEDLPSPTPVKKEIVHEVMMAMKARDVKCPVAPYEADA